MKEWTIRFGCVLLGAAITLGTTKLVDMVRPIQSDVEEVDTSKEEVDSEAKKELITDYTLEAELKLQEILDQQEAKKHAETVKEELTAEAEEFEETEETMIIPGSVESAPVKWTADYPKINSDTLLEEKMLQRSSYDETMAVNAFDKMVIENSTVDFSNVKITVMGDSITEGNTLPEDEIEAYNWPKQLEQILGCKEVVNMGKGGSTVSSCVDNYPMCGRWSDIDSDSDIIIVMGGSNDCLFEDSNQFGAIEYEKRLEPNTFCGDLDDMLGRMKWSYREHNSAEHYCKMIYINPPATILNNAVREGDPNVIEQSKFAEAINTIAPAYDFEVIDLYNNNILNSIDSDINAMYVPDGIHCNKEGYTILAEHIASQIIQRIDQ